MCFSYPEILKVLIVQKLAVISVYRKNNVHSARRWMSCLWKWIKNCRSRRVVFFFISTTFALNRQNESSSVCFS